MTDSADPPIAAEAMRARHWLVIAIMVLLNALDGFDVLSSAFAGPGIKAEWHLGPDGLGIVLSMELVGMGVGSLVLGSMADRAGRRPTILACLTLMLIGMAGAASAASPQALSAWRVLTGLGIGGMLAAVNALTHETASPQARSMAMALMVIGYPLGAFFGGLGAAALLGSHGWRAVFVLGAVMTGVMLPVFAVAVPEPAAWRARRLRGGAAAKTARLAAILAPEHARVTALVAFGYAAHAMAFYFILKMAPAVLSDPQFAGYHYSRAEGARVLAFANLGGAIGGGMFGWVMHRLGTRRATLIALALSFVMVSGFGLGQPSLGAWIVAIALIGAATNAAIVGFYAAFASLYPPELKATGTGFALAIGRAGAALAPIASGALFAHALPLQAVAAIMAGGSLLAFVLFAGLPARRTDGHDPDMVMADL